MNYSGKNDARIGLSKDAFRLLASEKQNRALVIFVPEDSNANYRFSLIEISFTLGDDDSSVTRTYSNPRRYSYYLGEGIACYTPNKYLKQLGRVQSVEDLFKRFSVEVLTKDFYNELSDWYAWAIKVIKLPNDLRTTDDDQKYNHEGAIRLITRLIFVWFLKQRGLIPWQFFDQEYIAENLLVDFNPHEITSLFGKSEESHYYKAILQNLFFAMLNSPITAEGSKEIDQRRFTRGSADFDNNKLMRYQSLFKNPDLFLELANSTVPFLNGGLFDCLDDKRNDFYYDGFSERTASQAQLCVPDYLFFGEEAGKNIDLSEFYGDKNKKKVSARGIIDILKRYNFTVEENMPFDKDVSLDPELLGKVFENLLASYNPETQQTARKQTGSFYTPREIVQYMVDESLVAHLKRTVSPDLEGEYRKLLSYADDEFNLTDAQKIQIMHSLYNCKILDPACGSGAFPVGVLQQMVHILTQIDPDNSQWKKMLFSLAAEESDAASGQSREEQEDMLTDLQRSFNDNFNRPDYSRKLYLIENCIYGVDIQPIAIQISKLRFFISLVVDQKINNDPTDNFGIRPLPNLEAKFVAANSLLGLKRAEATLFDTDEIKKKEALLKTAKHKIFSAKTSKTKEKYREQVHQLRQEIADMLVEQRLVGNDQAQQLAKWDMFDQNAVSPFFDPEWMFGVKDGFDVVIGNPPYVQLQKNGGELAKIYESEKFKTFARTGDIYTLFYERGHKLLNADGHLCFITSNKWMRAGYGDKTREFFAKETDPKLLIDFAGTKVFESATVDTNILLFSKSTNKGETVCCIVDGTTELSDFVAAHSTKTDFSAIGSDSWTILSEIEKSIKAKIEAVGTPLKDWDIAINYGIKTGFNDAFIIDTATRNSILEACQSDDERERTKQLIRPILRGRDIKRYGYNWANLWLINTHNGIKGSLERIHIEDYPAIKAHLDKFWDKISTRSDKGDTPYNLRNCAYMDDFHKPKIVWGEISDRTKFCLDNQGEFVPEATTFLMVGENLPYIMGMLNSHLSEYLFSNIGTTTGVGTTRWKKFKIIELPIYPWVASTIQLQISEAAKQGEGQQSSVDQLVYELYNLSDAEIEFVEQWCGR